MLSPFNVFLLRLILLGRVFRGSEFVQEDLWVTVSRKTERCQKHRYYHSGLV